MYYKKGEVETNECRKIAFKNCTSGGSIDIILRSPIELLAPPRLDNW